MRCLWLLIIYSLLLCSCRYMTGNYIQPEFYSLTRADYPAAPTDPECFADTSNAQTSAWIQSERALYYDYMSRVTYHDTAMNRLRQICNYQRISNITAAGKRYLYNINDGGDSKDKLYIQESLNREPEEMFNPSLPFMGMKIRMKSYEISPDGKWMTMSIQCNNEPTDWILLWNLDERRVIEAEILRHVKTKACWSNDGFYYGMYRGGVANKDTDESMMVKFHRVGTSPEEDKVIVEPYKGRSFWYNMRCFKGSPNGKMHLFLLPKANETTKGNNLYLVEQDEDGHGVLKVMHDGGDDETCYFVPIGMQGNVIYLRTNYGAPNGKVVRCTLDNLEQSGWRNVIPESDDPLISSTSAAGHIILTTINNGAHRNYVYTLDGKRKCEINVPDLSTVSFKSDMHSKDIFYLASSFVRPLTMYKYDIKTNTSFAYLKPRYLFNSDDFITERFMVPTADGMHVPLFITRHKKTRLTPETPCFFMGHGAMGVLSMPKFDAGMFLVLEQGGICATGVCRGGGEYGEKWHQLGQGYEKENTFIDYKASIDFLVNSGFTSPERLALIGRGLGCINIAVMANRHPELFSVALMTGPFLDVLNLERYGRAKVWGNELGYPDGDRGIRDFMLGYAPLQNLRPGQQYPAVLSIAHINDKQIPPLHTMKYISALQNMDSGTSTKLGLISKGQDTELQKNEEFSSLFSFAWFNWNLPYLIKK